MMAAGYWGYPLYDQVSSTLAQEPPDSWLYRRPQRRSRPVYFQGSNVGVIDFVLAGEPHIVVNLVDFIGRTVWEPFVVCVDELVNGVASWPAKVDNAGRQRQESHDGGERCYEVDPGD